MVLLVYVFLLQRLLKCSRPSCYHICWTSCGAFGTERASAAYGWLAFMVAHYIGVASLIFWIAMHHDLNLKFCSAAC